MRPCTLTVFVWLGMAWASLGVTVREVRVDHEEGIPVDPGLEELVKAQVSIKAGDEWRIDPEFNTRAVVSRDIKAIQETEAFSMVRAHVEPAGDDVVVVYVVRPRLTIRSLRISGARALSNKKIRKLLELGYGDRIDEALFKVRAQKVRESYRKKYYPSAEIVADIQSHWELGVADVNVEVKEGTRSRVKSIEFTGNEHVSDWALRKVMVQKRLNPLSWLTRRGVFSEDDLRGDLVRIRRLFLEKGFLDAVVEEPDVQPVSHDRVAIVIPITEGAEYHVREIRLDGVTRFPQAEVESVVWKVLAPGAVASITAMEQAAQAIRDHYGSRGHVNTRVIQDLAMAPGVPELTVTYTVSAGPRARLRNVDISGNRITQDKVIRREISVFPGEQYNSVKIRSSERRLRNLRYFSFVGSTPVEVPPAMVSPGLSPEEEELDLLFEVEETTTGQLELGVGIGSIDEIMVYTRMTQSNFDQLFTGPFRGGGRKLRVSLSLGTQRRDIELGFTEPWFLDRRLTLGTSLFQHERRFLSDDYDQLNTGGRVSLTRPLPGPHRISFAYTLEEIEVYDVADSASDIIKEEEGARIKSAGSLQVWRDTRNHYIIPTRGGRTSATATLAGGPFAGETDLYELRLRSGYYFPVWKDHVLNLRGQLAFADIHSGADRVPIFDRLFLGGPRTMRGFDFRDVGPKDENGEPLGGLSLIYGTIEYTIPVFHPVRAAAYYDIGMVYEDPYKVDFGDLNSDVGVGLRLDLPMFPIQLDYAWPLMADEFNDRSTGLFSFSMGYAL